MDNDSTYSSWDGESETYLSPDRNKINYNKPVLCKSSFTVKGVFSVAKYNPKTIFQRKNNNILPSELKNKSMLAMRQLIVRCNEAPK